MDPISIHFHEIALKGKNRISFERKLQQNLKLVVSPLGKLRVDRFQGGLLVDGEGDQAEVLKRILEVCGVAYAMPVVRHGPDLDAVARTIVDTMQRMKPANFRISSRRREKQFALSSEQVNQQLGKAVQDATGVRVKLHGAELEAFVLLLRDQILVGTEKHKAIGGLPVGTAGRVAALLSGGIDSPVAAWRMMRRGCRADFVHFHSYPRVDRATIDKAEDLAETLTRWQYKSHLWLVPLLEVQNQARLLAPERLRVLIYRRFMVRIAERLARQRKCRALVTGESVGQVASQTLQNIAAVDAVANMPILRPLCGMDKQEIIEQSHVLGTFEISIQPDQDCCQLFLPRHPVVTSTHEECLEAESKMDVEALVQDAVDRTEHRSYRWPVKRTDVMDDEPAKVA